MTPANKVPPENRAEVRRRYLSGESLKVIAHECGIGYRTVIKITREMGIPSRRSERERMNISVPIGFLCRLDELARERRTSRSALVTTLLKEALG